LQNLIELDSSLTAQLGLILLRFRSSFASLVGLGLQFLLLFEGILPCAIGFEFSYLRLLPVAVRSAG